MIEQRVKEYFEKGKQTYESIGIHIPPFELVETPSLLENAVFRVTTKKTLFRKNKFPDGVKELLDIQLEVLRTPIDNDLRERLEESTKKSLKLDEEKTTMIQRLKTEFRGPRYTIHVTPQTKDIFDEQLSFYTAHELWHIAEIEVIPRQHYHPLIVEGTSTYAGIRSIYQVPEVMSELIKVVQKFFRFENEIQNMIYYEGAKITSEVMKAKELPELLTNKEVRETIDERMKKRIMDYYCEKPELLLPLSITIFVNQMTHAHG